MLIQLYGARLQHAPVVGPARVLDIGTGIGSWAIEFGMFYQVALPLLTY